MPIIQSRPDMTAAAKPDTNWRAPHRTLQANTRNIKDALTRPGAATTSGTLTEVNPEPKEIIQAQTIEPTENHEVPGQSTPSEDTKPQAVTLSPQLTALARKEQAFRRQEQAFKTQQQEFKAQQDAFEKTKAEFSAAAQLKERLAADDYSVLDELGVSYEKYTNFLLNKGEVAPEQKAIQELKSELAALKRTQEEATVKQKEAVDKQYEATVAQYRKEIKDIVATDPAYDSIKTLKAEDHVLQLILDTFNEDGEVLSVSEAAKEIEDFLVEDALAMSKLKKVQEKLQPAATEKKVLPPPSTEPIKTITNKIAPASTKTYSQFQHMSPGERLRAAIAKAQRT